MTTASTACFESFHQFADIAIESMMNLGAVVVAAEADMETTLKSLREVGNALSTVSEVDKGNFNSSEKIELSVLHSRLLLHWS